MHRQCSWEEAALQLATDHTIQANIRQIFHVLKYILGAGFITGIVKMGIHQMIVINKTIPAKAFLPLPQKKGSPFCIITMLMSLSVWMKS